MNNKPISRKDNIVVQTIDDETLIYDLSTNKAYCLNKTSALIWQLCDGKKSVSQIRESISKKLNLFVTEELVLLALSELNKENLLEDTDETSLNFDGLSRRDVIRKVGLTSIIALPIISIITAPKSVQAMSCVAPNQNVGTPVTTAAECDQFDSLCCNGNAISGFGCGSNCVTCRCAVTP